ncbi:hypothetical protein [Zoogloea sp.]|uniref:hypothetical protein n=1 Tax=Zoogloea sp. TaxID=49181 RepID=UPI002630B249|nr:hypothetical protein [Zoogloea sp.]
MTAKIGFFDKDQDQYGLAGYATSCRLQFYASVDDALKSSVDCLFVHVRDSDWTKICGTLPKERVALRFTSSSGYPRSPPEGKHGNCFRCLKPTKNDGKLTEHDFHALVAAFGDIEIVNQLSTSIPREIRDLVAWSTVHRLRALHILLQACMAELGNNPKHGAEAISILGCLPVPSSSHAKVNRVELFCRVLADFPWPDSKSYYDAQEELYESVNKALQHELGVRVLKDEDPIIHDLVCGVFNAVDPDAPLAWETIKKAFQRLDVVLGMLRRDAS